MDRLALPVSQLRDSYDVLVVGSGYGGAVAAYRVAERLKQGDVGPVRICMLERGPERHPGEYPRTFLQAVRLLRVSGRLGSFGSSRGLFDLRLNEDVSVLAGSGLGGTSLINAGVMLRPDWGELVRKGWPEELFDRGLSAGFARAERMIRPQRYPASWPELKKRIALTRVAAPGAAGAAACRDAPLAVSFVTGTSAGGVQMKACNLCGDCVTGCNHSAKSTLLTNYIPAAVREGVEVYCGVSARWLEPAGSDPARDGWRVHLAPLDRGWRRFHRRDDLVVHARVVVLAAGTLGTTEILLRSRERAGPARLALSDQLGKGFSGNGDVIALGYNNGVAIDGHGAGAGEPDETAPTGPTITGVLDERGADADRPRVLIEEGAVPRAAALLVRLFAPLASRVSRYGGPAAHPPLRARLRGWWREVESLVHGTRAGALRNTQTYLVLGDDSDGGADLGTIDLHRDRVRIRWPGVGRQRLFRQVNERLREATRRLGGSHVANPFWSGVFGWKLLTVHPLGGCRMATDARSGVVDPEGRVFRTDRGDPAAVYDNLYVCDGAVIPSPLGVNPLLTISAIAERTSERLVAAHQEGLRAAARENARVRERAQALPRGGPRPGLAFSERMRGTIRLCDEEGAPVGPETRLDLLLHVRTPDVERMIADRDHGAGVTGLGWAPALSASPLRVARGGFNLFTVDTNRVEIRNMAYRLTLAGADGISLVLTGKKTFCAGPGARLTPWARWTARWRELTTLDLRVYDPGAVRRPGVAFAPIARGTLRMRGPDVLRSIASLRISEASTVWEGLTWKLRFLRFYLGVLRSAFGPFLAAGVGPPLTEARQYRALFPGVPRSNGAAAPPPHEEIGFEEHEVITRDRVPIHLSRHWKGERPGEPVLLAPGFGSSTYTYTVASPNARRNFMEFLVDAGYDVWLLDYRASELSPGSGLQFTIDDVAEHDYPAAVEHIFQATGGRRVRVLGHCVASLALLMALLRGWLDESRVRSAVCSQGFVFVEFPRINRWKAHLRLAEALHFLRFWPTLTPDWERRPPLRARLFDQVLRFYPSDERCQSPVCRRLLFLYGEVCRHDRIDTPTHAAIGDMFNRSNLTTFLHLTRIARERRLVDHRGRDVYLVPENVRRIRVPVSLVQGAKNGIFLRKGGVASYRWLTEHQDPSRPVFAWHEFGDYGHLDTFIGRYTYDGEAGRPADAPEPTYETLRELLARD